MKPQEIALSFIDEIKDHCTQIEVAGSVRRGKTDPKDIEIVAIDKGGLLLQLDTMLQQKTVAKAIYGTKTTGMYRWGQKYRGLMYQGFRVELFLGDAMNWGYIYWLRTGPGDANQWIMQALKWQDAPFKCKDGYVQVNDTKLSVPNEEVWFDLLNIPFAKPAERSIEYYKAFIGAGHAWGHVPKTIQQQSLF